MEFGIGDRVWRKTRGENRKELLEKQEHCSERREMIGTDLLGKMNGHFFMCDDTRKPSEMGASHS